MAFSRCTKTNKQLRQYHVMYSTHHSTMSETNLLTISFMQISNHLFFYKFLLLEIVRILTDIRSPMAFMSIVLLSIYVVYGSPGTEHKVSNRLGNPVHFHVLNARLASLL